jgi:hypothetical protein
MHCGSSRLLREKPCAALSSGRAAESLPSRFWDLCFLLSP